jgi:hypothetical protein
LFPPFNSQASISFANTSSNLVLMSFLLTLTPRSNQFKILSWQKDSINSLNLDSEMTTSGYSFSAISTKVAASSFPGIKLAAISAAAARSFVFS